MITYFDIGEDFSRLPMGRTKEDGEYNGERFRTERLIPILEQKESKIVILLDNALGYPSSWLDEVFGGLVIYHGYTQSTLKNRLDFRTTDLALYAEIWSYIESASALSPVLTKT